METIISLDAASALPDAEKCIRISSLTKRFQRRGGGGEVIPVNDVSLDVATNEMLVLLGPSGCGKTTLLRCIAGLERPDIGDVVISGKTAFSSGRNIFMPPNKRPISMVFQSYALWPHMTVFENVAFPLRSRGLRGAQVQERVDSVLDLVGLEGLARQYTSQISGGQQQRVALARAVAAKTGVVLFDEPLSNVDAKVREQLRGEIARMQRALGFSGVYVTHDQVEAMAIGDRIAVLNNGRIEQLGSPEEIYMRPANKYVATFIGVANIVPGTVLKVADRDLTLRTAIGEVTVSVPPERIRLWGGLPGEGDTAFVLARPEAFGIAPEGAGGADAIPCKVVARSFLGAYTEYLVSVPDGEPLRVWFAGLGTIAEGDSARLTVAAADLVLLGDRA